MVTRATFFMRKVMWLDSDLIFLNDEWVPETAQLLDRYPVVQPFGWMTYLPAGEVRARLSCAPTPWPGPRRTLTLGGSRHLRLPAKQGVDYAVEQLASLPLGQGVGGVYHSAGLGLQSFPAGAVGIAPRRNLRLL